MTTNRPRVRRPRREDWSPERYNLSRVEAGLTFEAVADALGVSLSTAHAWSVAHKPTPDQVRDIAALLKVPQRRLIR